MVDPAVTGYRHLLTLDGNAKIASGRAQVTLFAGAIAAPNLPGGDKLLLKLDAVPDQNKLDMGLQIRAPGNGFVAKLANLTQPLAVSVERQRQLGELERPCGRDARRQELRQCRDRRPQRHLHPHRPARARTDDDERAGSPPA